MSRMIIAVGGTGQIVLLHYLQLYLLGVVEGPFRAVVVDTDEILPPISTISRLLEQLQYGSEKTAALGETLPVIEVMRPNTQVGETLTEILTGNRHLEPFEKHPVRAFFSSETLEQNLMRGLFARPAMSSVLSSLQEDVLRPAANSTVVLVGSLIGGTGGGLMVPLCDALYSYQVREGIDDVKLRGVFFGQYFTPQAGRLEGDVQRFRSSQLCVLKSIQEALHMLHSFYIVGGTGGTVERDPEEEKRGVNFPWPRSRSHPFWEGVQALEFLLGESAKEKGSEFRDREFAEVDDRPDIEHSRLRLAQSLQVARRFIHKETIRRLAAENWLDTIWGPGLTDLIAHYWKTSIKTEGRDQALKQFPGQVQQSLTELWKGEGAERGLRTAFPNPDEQGRVRPRHVRAIPWPRLKIGGSQDLRLFDGPGNSAERLAATLLFWILRKGELK